MEAHDDLKRGREYHKAQSWLQAFECLSSVDRIQPLDADDLERQATAAYMLGRDADYVDCLERAHDAYLERDDVLRAVRCGFWIGHSFLFRGNSARATGWFERARRLLGSMERDCVERGYLLIPKWLQQMDRGNLLEAHDLAIEAAEIGERFGDADLVWLARDDQAKALMRLGHVEEGLRLVDEALVAATIGELSPIVTGIVYCNTIVFCRSAYEFRHVREWTHALSKWCEAQPEMVAHNGLCLVHRAEVKLLEGDWTMALAEAHRAAERFTSGALNQLACGRAYYCQGEAHRLKGEFEAAEQAYRNASHHGCEPQPGLALMRLAEGNVDAAFASVRRVVAEKTADLSRVGILPAYVEIVLAKGDLDRARSASRELTEIAERSRSEVVQAKAAFSRGAVALAEDSPEEALLELRPALNVWLELAAPYEIARVRALIAKACLMHGDQDTAAMEIAAARDVFEELGARPDQVRLERFNRRDEFENGHELTPRQLEVLRLVASGKTNREIAAELFVSEHTISRHVQNIFAKLDVSSRTAATAFAFENNLV